MSTMNISLPEALKSFVDDQVNARGYNTSSEQVRELIRKDQDRQSGALKSCNWIVGPFGVILGQTLR